MKINLIINQQEAAMTLETAPQAEEPKTETLPAWQRPTITRIDLRQTLFGTGSLLDGAKDSGRIS
jgi:hypothetical protein